MPVFDKKNPAKIIKIEEKPKEPKSFYAQTGLYIYDGKVFHYIKTNKPGVRGEMEITDVNNRYIEAEKFHWAELNGFWSDAGTFQSLFKSNKYWAEKAENK